jgi:hypothetical protein
LVRNTIALCPPDLISCLARSRDKLTGADCANLPWQAIGLLAALAFVSSLIGHSLTRNAFVGAIIATIIFLAVYIAWDYYPHGMLGGIRFPNEYVPSR